MKFKIGDKVRVVNPYSGGNFEHGDVVTIAQIGFEGEDCYGAISPYDNIMWFLEEDEVTFATNADYIRGMNNEELAKVLSNSYLGCVVKDCRLHNYASYDCEKKFLWWLQQPANNT